MIRTSIILAAVLLVAGSSAPAGTSDTTAQHVVGLAGPEVQVNMMDGTTVSGNLTAASAGEITIQCDGKAVTVPSEQLLSVTPKVPPEPSGESPTAWIELVDGSKLSGAGFTVKNGTAAIALDGTVYRIPTSAIRNVRFSKPGDPASPVWPAKVGADAMSDLLAVRKKDTVDFNEGVLVSVNEDHVLFQLEGETIPVARTKIDGLIFFHKAGDTLPEPKCIIEECNGRRISARDFLLSKGKLEISTSLGLVHLIPVENITRIDFSIGKVVYLSDLEPDSVRWTPYLDIRGASEAMEQYYAPRRDEGREHQPLVTGGKKYTKGLGLYSRTEMTFRLPAGAKKFKALAGIDDSVRDVGGVRLVISTDGKKIFDKSITGSDGPVDIDLDVAGASG